MTLLIGALITLCATLIMARIRKSSVVHKADLGRMSNQWLAEQRASTSGKSNYP